LDFPQKLRNLAPWLTKTHLANQAQTRAAGLVPAAAHHPENPALPGRAVSAATDDQRSSPPTR